MKPRRFSSPNLKKRREIPVYSEEKEFLRYISEQLVCKDYDKIKIAVDINLSSGSVGYSYKFNARAVGKKKIFAEYRERDPARMHEFEEGHFDRTKYVEEFKQSLIRIAEGLGRAVKDEGGLEFSVSK